MTGAVRRKARTLRGVLDRYGAVRTGGQIATVVLGRLHLWRGGFTVTRPVTPADAAPAEPLRGRLAVRDELLALAARGTAFMGPRFVEERLALGDRCVVADHDGTIVSYQWWATRALRQFGAAWEPNDGWLLHHRMWTDPACRGQRLSERLFADGLALLYTPGLRGVVGVVEFANYASRAALARMGLHPTGFIMRFGPDGFGVTISRLPIAPLRRTSWPPR